MRSFFIILFISMSLFGLSFVNEPTIVQNGSTWTVAFEVDEATDVAVSIVNTADSTIVRHLAAGMLGSNPPAPLAANALAQTLTWDGKDDLGNTVTGTGNISVRVRAGMSVSLDKMVGGTPYGFQFNNGLYVDRQGNLFVLGGGGRNKQVVLRQYDGSGTYQKTVFPFPASHTASSVAGLGIWEWQNGTHSPTTTQCYGPVITNTMLNSSTAILLSYADSGKLVVGDIRRNQMIVLNDDGTIEGDGQSLPLVASPDYIGYYNFGGPGYATLSADGKYIYLSGLYYATNATSSQPDTLLLAPDTGFWADGQVFKVDAATGAASPFIALSNVPSLVADRKNTIGPSYGGWGYWNFAALHGTAIDDSGHIFVCDRLNDRVGVYDTSGTYLGGVSVYQPDLVSVNRTSGALYVSNRIYPSSSGGCVKLFKFNTWRNNPAPVCSVNVICPGAGDCRKKTYMGLSLSGTLPLVWIVQHTSGIRAYQDDNNALTLVRNFTDQSAGINTGFDRLDVDRVTETAYLNDAWNGIYKVEDWSNPQVVLCTTSANQRLYGTDFCISFDNQIYVREGTGYSGTLTRYTLDRYHAPVNFANSGKNMLAYYIYSRYHGTGGYGEKGFGVSPDKKVGIMYMYDWAKYFVGVYGDSGCGDSTQYCDTLIKPLNVGRMGVGGVRYDLKGNIYIGVANEHLTREEPAGVDWSWSNMRFQGNVVRFAAGQTGYFDDTGVHGNDKVYATALSPFSGARGECICRSPRFDIDMYGRLFIPNALQQFVTVVDNNGNTIVRFGQYGNVDSKGPGSLVPNPEFPFAWPTAAAASNDYICVSDMINTRIVRVRMNYALDNMPYFTAGVAKGIDRNGMTGRVALAVRPNPFHGLSNITVNMPERADISLSVYDVTGKLVKKISSGMHKKGAHHFRWNGRNIENRSIAAGIYIYRLTAGNRVLIRKVIFTK